MNRRDFLSDLAAAGLALPVRAWGQAIRAPGTPARYSRLNESAVGQPVNLATYGELTSWINPQAVPKARLLDAVDEDAATTLRMAGLQAPDGEADFGVEWPEFRTVNRVVIRFADSASTPERGRLFVEYWSGLTPLQGAWKTFEDGLATGVWVERDGPNWSFRFPPRRTCKVRIRLDRQPRVALSDFAVYGPSRWNSGEIRLEWGHSEREQSYDGHLESYNAEVLDVQPFGGASLDGWSGWKATAGAGKISGVRVKLLYTSGMDVDRSILTVRSKAGDFSFLPGLAIGDQPIDIPHFGVYILDAARQLDRKEYRRRTGDRPTIIEAVAHHPEQTAEGAYRNIRANRVTLSFIGVEANNQKFGIAPDGHLVVGNTDPSYGESIKATFAVYFGTTEEPHLFQSASDKAESILTEDGKGSVVPKDQQLAEGWLPILITRWSENNVSFERTDYAYLHGTAEPFEEARLNGSEPAVMISRLRIRNEGPVAETARYYIRPWKPARGGVSFGPMPSNVKNAWQTGLRDDCILVTQGDSEHALCYFDRHSRGELVLEPPINGVRYSVEIGPAEEHVVHTVLAGWIPPAQDAAALRGLAYDRIYEAATQYWKARLRDGMQVDVPDARVQNIWNASLHHFLLVLTKDGRRGEYYPNVAMLGYGSIGSESSPVMQSLDMRGLHDRAAGCLDAFLSTQGDMMPAGDYNSKEGGFFRFWPIYTVNQGAVLWTLAEHYLYTRDEQWLRKVAPQIVSGCDFIIRERNRTKKDLPDGRRPLTYGLAPAGCVADPRDWEYSFMLNAYFYLGLKKSAQVLEGVDPRNAARVADEARDYLQCIRRALNESVVLSPVTRLRDNTCVPVVPPYLGLRGFSSDVKDAVDPDRRHAYAYDCTIGPLHLLKGEVLAADDPEVTWMLNALEDRFFLFTPLPSRVQLDRISTDWFNLGGFEKLQPYYVHYQDAYLERDQIPNFLRGFFNTLASISDPQTLTFQEELDFSGGMPHKTHEEGWFFHQLRFLLVKEMGNHLFLARGTPRAWLQDGKEIAVHRAPTYFGETGYQIHSYAAQGRIEASVAVPRRNPPAKVYLRLRHPMAARMQRVTLNGRLWRDFDSSAEWISIPLNAAEARVVAYY